MFDIFFLGNNDKIVIVDIEKINIIAIGIFSIQTKTVIIKFYLLSFLISVSNYFKENINLLINENNFNISKNKIYMDIYQSFLFLPFKNYFEFLSRKIFKRQKLKIKNIFYKNYYLVELNSDKIIFSLQSLYNMNSVNGEGGSKYQLKIHKKDQIWKEILYHCHKLENKYMNKYSFIFNEEHYQYYYAFLELKSTFPRRTFLIKFLPILNGLALIHEYIQIKLASVKGEENIYKECESFYGFNEDIKFQNGKNNSNNNNKIFIENEPIILKKVNLFFVESFFIKTSSLGLFNGIKRNNIYISQEIMNIINRHILSLKNINIIKNIQKDLYEEYLELIKAENHEFEMNSSKKLIVKNNNDISSISFNEGLNSNGENNNSQTISLNITKKFILKILFDKSYNIFKDEKCKNLYSSSKNYNFKDNHNSIKKISNSKKDVNKLSEILNDSISDYTGTLNIFNKHKNDDNNNIIESNSFIINTIFDSNIFFNNGENSIIKEDLFNIDISNVQKEEKHHRKISFLNNKNNIDFQNEKINFNNKSTKKQENYDGSNSENYNLGSKEEFLEGEIKKEIK